MLKTIGQYSYSTEDWLGTGSFATVYKGHKITTNEPVAVKEINLKRLERLHNYIKIMQNITSEIETMRMLKHTNILQLYDVINDDNCLYIILEYCNGGDLISHINKQSKTLKKSFGLGEIETHKYAVQIAHGLDYMHAHGIIHRDLKPQNILLSLGNDNETIIKIADFGFAKVIGNQLTETVCGSPLYMAPEVLGSQKYNDTADLWSYGVMLYEMLAGHSPFNAKNIVDLSRAHRMTEKITLPSNIFVTSECRDLITSLLVVDTRKRMTWKQLNNHPWINRKHIDEQIVLPFITRRTPAMLTPCCTTERDFGSAPTTSHGIRKWVQPSASETRVPVNDLLKSFIVINKNEHPHEEPIINSISIDNMAEHELLVELRHWVIILTTLIELGDHKNNMSYHCEAELIYKHCQRLCQTICTMMKQYIKEWKNDDCNIEDLSQLSELSTLFETDEIILLCKQIHNIEEESTKKSLHCTRFKDAEHKPTEVLLYDTATSLRMQGTVEMKIDARAQAITHFKTAIYLLESLIPYAMHDSKQNLSDIINDLRHKII
jgi:serine/threonine-protein kinase ULK/ATG1